MHQTKEEGQWSTNINSDRYFLVPKNYHEC